MRCAATLAASLVFAVGHARAETAVGPAATDATPPAAEAVAAAPEGSPWSFHALVSTYVVPNDHDYVQPTVTADHGWVHLEARYAYEAMRTGSLWVGYNLSGDEALVWELTPMIGGVVGDTSGIAPGYRGTIGWWTLELFSEGEYVFDTSTAAESFFYAWSELALAPVEWGRFGLAGQRTRAYKTERDVQRGVFVGVSYKRVDLTAYVFDPDTHEPTVVVAVGVTF